MKEKGGRREKEKERESKIGSYGCVAGMGIEGKRRRVGSRRKYRLFYYAKAFSAVGSFQLRAVALPIESRRRRRRRWWRRWRRVYGRWRKLGKSLRPRIT